MRQPHWWKKIGGNEFCLQELGHLKTLAIETLDQDMLIGLTQLLITLTGS